MGKYRNHKNANFGVNDEDLIKCEERVTFLSFEQWVTFYNADPEHWIDFENSNYESGRRPYHLPVYKINTIKNADVSGRPYQHWEYRYIKFLTRKDYIQYLCFMKAMKKKGEDYQNTKETLELAKIVRAEGAKRVEALQKEQAEAVRRNQEIIDNMDSAADLINFMIRGGQAK